MGVLQRIVTTVPHAKTSSASTPNNGSNPDSEYESATESEQHRATAQQRQVSLRNHVQLQLQDDVTSAGRANKCGKRKQRRFMNRDFLLQKVDEDEETDALDVMEFRKSAFQRLYETMSAIAALATMNALERDDSGEYKTSVAPTIKPKHPYLRISRRIRHSIRKCVRRRAKARMVVQVVLATEEKILSQRSGSEWTLKLLWNNYIHRLLLHAVAQYHGFKSTTILIDDDGTEHVVRVTGTTHIPENEQRVSLLHGLMRFVYTDALADALTDAIPEHELSVNCKS